jgi:hypothetical protein
MKTIISYLIINLFFGFYAIAGDYAGGKSLYSVDLSEKFTTYEMNKKDKKWVSSLVKNLKYRGKIVHFVRTSLLLKVENSVVQNSVYQAIEKLDYFYVLYGDAMMKIGTEATYSPRVGGFSTHMQKSKDFIVCLNFQRGGVRFVDSSKVTKGLVSWKGWELPSTPLVEVIESAKITFPNYSEEKLNAMFKDALWNHEKSAVVVYPPDVNKTSIYIFIKNESDEFMGVDISKVERGNLGTIGLDLKFEKVETKAIKWLEHEKYYWIHMETKAWRKGQRYKRFERLFIDKSGRVLWR